MKNGLLISLLLFANTAIAQDFITDEDYRTFFKSHHFAAEDRTAIWWITIQFANEDRTWNDLLAFHKRHATMYPNSEHHELVVHRIATLKRMTADSKPPESRKIARLIYELRNVQAFQFMEPNNGLKVLRGATPESLIAQERNLPPAARSTALDVRRRLRGSRNAAQLLYEEYGTDCVEELIDHIDDDTLTRSVDYWRSFTYSHHVLTVGDICREILDKLVPPARIFEIEMEDDSAETKTAMKKYYAQRIRAMKKLAVPEHSR